LALLVGVGDGVKERGNVLAVRRSLNPFMGEESVASNVKAVCAADGHLGKGVRSNA
jgi:hypothetical protein